MKLYFQSFCVSLFVVFVFFPNFSPKKLRTDRELSARSNLPVRGSNGVVRTFQAAASDAVRFRQDLSNVYLQAGFAEANDKHLRKRNNHEVKQQKERVRKKRRKIKANRSRSGKNRRNKHATKRFLKNTNKIHAKSLDSNQRRKLKSVLKELNSYHPDFDKEACGTRWSRTSAKESNAKFQPHKTYGIVADESFSSDNRNRRHVLPSYRETVAYFPGSSVLKRNGLNISSDLFTVELWVKPEGGQHDPAIILASGRRTDSVEFDNVWEIGIKSRDENTVFYFSKKLDAGRTIAINSSSSYKPEEWTHLAVNSDSWGTIRLFVNGVQVGVRHDQGNDELERQGSQCDTLILGGNEQMTQRYRGMVDKLRIWDVARTQPDIRQDIYNFETFELSDSILISEDFDRFEQQWSSVGDDEVIKLHERTPDREYKIHFPEVRAPHCGQTVCDNPQIVRSYVENWILRKPKFLRYNIININDDDGTNSMFTQEDVEHQNSVLQEVFGRHNITWQPTLVHINDSFLRRKSIGCEPEKIGNRQCNRECMYARLGHDGGDCDDVQSQCDVTMKGDGHCDKDCNKIYHDWDSGDCCDPSYTDTDETCFDPGSLHRSYLSVSEYKSMVAAGNVKQLSVLFANWTNPNSIGVSTFPWDKDVFTSQGGTVVQLRRYTTREEMSGLVHELGHNLGLLHVHHGAHNVDCDDTCAELRASMTTGDLCEDTNPTPMNTRCGEPNGTQSVCSIHNFTRTPYSNFMSYADGSCQDNFTPQQRARMHCYIDLIYGEWTEKHTLPPIPLPPKVVAVSNTKRSITLAWAPPIDGKLIGNDENCDVRCTVDKRLRQFAINASSPGSIIPNGWSPQQATGPPDQQSCTLRGVHFWMPSSATEMNCGPRCRLDLDFEEPVIPYMLRIWVTYGTEDGDEIKSIEFVYEDGTTKILTKLQTSCDTPLSVHVKSNKKTKKIRIRVNYPYTAIDAVELISAENNPKCTSCRRIKYKIHRDPPFEGNSMVATEQLQFADGSLENDVTYSYSVQPILHQLHGEISPAVQFRIGQTFCGDGDIQNPNSNGEREECDDGNLEDEDGCNSSCGFEKGFHCKGSPSMCYWYDGDGMCEYFEENDDSKDCILNSDSYIEQWAVDAFSSSAAIEALYSGEERSACQSSKEVVGSPDSTCNESKGVWSPCNVEGLTKKPDEHWIKVFYEKPVVPLSVSIYARPLGKGENQKKFILSLPDEEIITTKIGLKSCIEKPFSIKIPEKNGRTAIKYFILKFKSDTIGIDAISLKSRRAHDQFIGQRHGMTTFECIIDDYFENSNVTCSSSTLNSSSYGSIWPNTTTCSVSCHPGHFPKSARKMTCINGHWDAKIKCVPISCGAPSHIKFASFSCKQGYTLNDVCNFTCRKQSHLIGNDNNFKCQSDGSWSIPSSFCEPRCSNPPSIGFATSACNALTKTSSRPGETCKYRCKTGYHVTQQPLNRRTFRLTCGVDGVWKGPGCQPVLCEAIPTIYKGMYKCTLGFVFGSECSMSCLPFDSEVTETIRCGSNGQWNASFTLCPNIQTSCDIPIPPAGIEITCDGYNTGQTCRASCALKGPPNDIVTLNEESSLPEPNRKIKILVCAGESWFPNPEHLYCIAECDSQFIGDKWCDASNNRAYCGWDGGDCCASTTTGKQVERFPSSCTSECDCKDPQANENKPLTKNEEVASDVEIRNRVVLVPVNEGKSVKISTPKSTQKTSTSLADIFERNYATEREEDKNERNKRKRKRGRSGKHLEFDINDASLKRKQKSRSKVTEEAGEKRRRRHRRSKIRLHLD